MLTSEPTPLPATLATRLIVEPRIRVRTSVLPAEDPERASAVCADSGVPLALLARHGATVRQTHRRANVVVIDVPAERQDALRSDLAAAGFDARPPKPVSLSRLSWPRASALVGRRSCCCGARACRC